MRKAFSFLKWTAFGTLAVASVLFVSTMWALDDGDDDAPKKVYAITACKTAITDSLKDPGSVEWVSWQDWPASYDEPLWSLQATYRAKNSFGAVVTETITCESVNGNFTANLVR